MTLFYAMLAVLTCLTSGRLDAGIEFMTPPWSLVVDPTDGMSKTFTAEHAWTEQRVRESAAGGSKTRTVAVAFRLGLPAGVMAEPTNLHVEVTDNTGAKVPAQLVAPFGDEEAGLLIENIAPQSLSFSIDQTVSLVVKGVAGPQMMTMVNRKLSPMFVAAPQGMSPETFMATDRDGNTCIDVVPAMIREMITDVGTMSSNGNRVSYTSMGTYTSDGEDFARYTFRGEFSKTNAVLIYRAVRKTVNCDITFRVKQIVVPTAALPQSPPK